MEANIFSNDLVIAKKLIQRDEATTREYFFGRCYPLFKSIFDHFYTDCENCKEFINQMYMVVLFPSKKTGRCQMENYEGKSTLTSWLKTACLYYCYRRYRIKNRMSIVSLEHEVEKEGGGDRVYAKAGSTELLLTNIDKSDLEILVKRMRNKRYQQIIRFRYIEQLSIKETAKILGMTVKNFYSKHTLAKAQLYNVIKEEECHA